MLKKQVMSFYKIFIKIVHQKHADKHPDDSSLLKRSLLKHSILLGNLPDKFDV